MWCEHRTAPVRCTLPVPPLFWKKNRHNRECIRLSIGCTQPFTNGEKPSCGQRFIILFPWSLGVHVQLQYVRRFAAIRVLAARKHRTGHLSFCTALSLLSFFFCPDRLWAGISSDCFEDLFFFFLYNSHLDWISSVSRFWVTRSGKTAESFERSWEDYACCRQTEPSIIRLSECV